MEFISAQKLGSPVSARKWGSWREATEGASFDKQLVWECPLSPVCAEGELREAQERSAWAAGDLPHSLREQGRQEAGQKIEGCSKK